MIWKVYNQFVNFVRRIWLRMIEYLVEDLFEYMTEDLIKI